jgi:hypothetical protein
VGAGCNGLQLDLEHALGQEATCRTGLEAACDVTKKQWAGRNSRSYCLKQSSKQLGLRLLE